MTDATRETLIELLNKHKKGEMNTLDVLAEIERVFPPTHNGDGNVITK